MTPLQDATYLLRSLAALWLFALALATAGSELGWLGHYLELVPLTPAPSVPPSVSSSPPGSPLSVTPAPTAAAAGGEEAAAGWEHVVRLVSGLFGGGLRGAVVAAILFDTVFSAAIEMTSRRLFEKSASVPRAFLPLRRSSAGSSSSSSGAEGEGESKKER